MTNSYIPEDSGQPLFDGAGVVEKLLKPPESISEAVMNGRFPINDGNAFVDLFLIGVKYRLPVVLQAIPLKFQVSGQAGGLNRVEASTAVSPPGNNQGFNIAKDNSGFFGRFKRKKSSDNLDQ